MTFAEKLKDLRQVKKLTQEQVAQSAGITRRTYVSYEQEGRSPRSKEIYVKLAKALDCSLDYLMTENEEFVLSVAEQYGSRGKKQAEELVEEFTGLFAGGELSEHDKDAVMAALQRVYFDCKLDNQKYTPKKYRKNRKSD